MRKKLLELKVSLVKKLSPDFFLLELKSPKQLNGIKPGQFANLKVPGNLVFLRRPFSIHDVNGKKISFLIKLVGKGTKGLAELKIGETISAVLPLGNGFKLIKKGKALLVGGGCGVAPLLLLAKELKKQKTEITLILGGKKKADIVRVKEFAKYAKVLITTEDGSLGSKGLVTAALQKLNLNAFDCIYTCGPEAMLRGLAKIPNRPRLQVSLEAMMACGFGVCLCCVTKTKKEGHVCVCTDGPVFEAEQLSW